LDVERPTADREDLVMKMRLRRYRLTMRRYALLPALVLQLRSMRGAKGSTPAESDLRRLTDRWSNSPGTAASPAYLQELARQCRSAMGPILECGSGLTTVLCSLYSPQPVWSLEHLPSWARWVRLVGYLAGLNPRVVRAELSSHGDFEWYSVPDGLPRHFSLVVCDGPPGDTRGGRFGLLPIMAHSISGATILLDDTDRRGEQEVLDRWRREYGVRELRRFPTFVIAEAPQARNI
jgi:hypothetical protein